MESVERTNRHPCDKLGASKLNNILAESGPLLTDGMIMVLKSDLVSKKMVCRWYGMSFK